MYLGIHFWREFGFLGTNSKQAEISKLDVGAPTEQKVLPKFHLLTKEEQSRLDIIIGGFPYKPKSHRQN